MTQTTGTKKECKNCGGTGRVNVRNTTEFQNTSWIPTQGEWVSVTKSDECDVCKGKGYLELTWI